MEPVKINGLLTVNTFCNHNHIRDGINQRDKTLTHDRLVVNHHDSNRVVIH